MRHTSLLLVVALAGALYAAADHAGSSDSAPVSDGDAARNKVAATAQHDNEGQSSELTKADRLQLENMAQDSLKQLLAESDNAKREYKASGLYAVFKTTKVGALVTGAGGSGVAVDPGTGQCVYMHMGAGGVALGGGFQQYKLVFLFADHDAFGRFVDGGWDGNTTAEAVAGKAAKEATSNFADATSVYQLTDKGLIAQADVTLMRFWKDHDAPATDSNALRCAS
jgi:lipid-binding SYLF domain-containing protein